MDGRARLVPFLLLSLVAGCSAPSSGAPDGYVAEIEQHRADREERLRGEGSWLTLTGLHWLKPGENRFGSDPSLPIVLDAEGVPAWAGSFLYDGESVGLKVAPGAEITVNDEPAGEGRTLRDDTEDEIDRLGLGRLTFYIIERDGRHGVRVKDPESPVRTEFRGLDYFPIDPGYRIDAAFVRYDEPLEVPIPTVLGTTQNRIVPGHVEFTLDGEPYTLQPVVGSLEDTELFFIFKDGTSGGETYGAGRFLSADLEDGRAVLDFNKAYNPPCAFTPYATCPLPPRANWLAGRIEAGERKFGEH